MKKKSAPAKRSKPAATAKAHAKAAPAAPANRWVGKPLRRKEETRLVQGKGVFVDDNKIEGMFQVKMVRSPMRTQEFCAWMSAPLPHCRESSAPSQAKKSPNL